MTTALFHVEQAAVLVPRETSPPPRITMEEIGLTNGQFQILLGMTPEPTEYTPEITSLVRALHKARVMGHLWRTKLSDENIRTALDLLMAHQAKVGTSAAKKAVMFFVRDSQTAKDHHRASQGRTDVPRETSTEAES